MYCTTRQKRFCFQGQNCRTTVAGESCAPHLLQCIGPPPSTYEDTASTSRTMSVGGSIVRTGTSAVRMASLDKQVPKIYSNRPAWVAPSRKHCARTVTTSLRA